MMSRLLLPLMLLAVVPCSAKCQPIAKARCFLRLLFLDFDVLDFDKYDRYFNDDSIMEFAAAGSYQGANGIAEYVRFATPSSPFILDGNLSSSDMTGELAFVRSIFGTLRGKLQFCYDDKVVLQSAKELYFKDQRLIPSWCHESVL
jgi:hypothetical protein